jgi:hypothetical protein
MHWVDALVGAVALALGLATAATAWGQADLAPGLRLAVALIGGATAVGGVFGAATEWLDQPGDPWNAARLAPAVALHYGYGLYYPLDTGPVLSTVVGPVSFLAYWPIGFLRSTPSALIFAGSALNLAVFALIVRALLRRTATDPATAWFAGFIGLHLAIAYPALRYSLFCIHSDAPALALIAVGVLVLLGGDPEVTAWRAAGAALCFTLAMWAKQSCVLVFVATAVILVLRDGRRTTVRFIAASAVVGAGVSLVFTTWLGFGALWMNMFQVPAHQAWYDMSLTTGAIHGSLAATGLAPKARVLVAATLQIVRSNWPLFALVAALFAEAYLHRQPGKPWWPRQNWAPFAFLAIALLPSAAVGRAKAGGAFNHESLSIFFLGLALISWLAEAATADRRVRVLGVTCVAGVLLAINLPRACEYRGWLAAWSNPNEESYNYDRAHPGQVYFPWFPLSSLLAEGKLYHFDWGVLDRNMGGAFVTPDHLAHGLPTARPVVAMNSRQYNYILRTYFPDYVRLTAELAVGDWQLYGPPPDSAVP